MLDLYAEPTMICDGAIYEARLTIALTGDARAIVSEIVACRTVRERPLRNQRDARRQPPRSSTCSSSTPKRALHIADVIGTLLILGPADHKTLDQVAEDCPNVRVGIGTFHQGDSIARIVGTQVEPVREAIARLRAASNPEGAWGAPRPHRGTLNQRRPGGPRAPFRRSGLAHTMCARRGPRWGRGAPHARPQSETVASARAKG